MKNILTLILIAITSFVYGQVEVLQPIPTLIGTEKIYVHSSTAAGNRQIITLDDIKSFVAPTAANDLRVSAGVIVRGSDSPTLPKGSEFTGNIYNILNGFSDAWVNGTAYYPFLIKNNGELWGWSDGTNSDAAANRSIFHFSPNSYGKFNAAVNSTSNIANFGIGAFNFGFNGICTGAFAGNFGFNGQSTAVASLNFGRDGAATAQYAMNFGAYSSANAESSINFGDNSVTNGLRSVNFARNGNIDANSSYGMNLGFNGQLISSPYSVNFSNNGVINNAVHGVNLGNGGSVANALSGINFAENGTVTANNAINMSLESNANSYGMIRIGLNGTALTGQNTTIAVPSDFKLLIDNGSATSSRNSTFSHIKRGWTQIRDVTTGNSSTTQAEIQPKSVLELVSPQSGLIPSGGTIAQRNQVFDESTQTSLFWSLTYTKGWLDASSNPVADQNGMIFQTTNEAGGAHLYALKWNGTIYSWHQIY